MVFISKGQMRSLMKLTKVVLNWCLVPMKMRDLTPKVKSEGRTVGWSTYWNVKFNSQGQIIWPWLLTPGIELDIWSSTEIVEHFSLTFDLQIWPWGQPTHFHGCNKTRVYTTLVNSILTSFDLRSKEPFLIHIRRCTSTDFFFASKNGFSSSSAHAHDQMWPQWL